MNPDTVGKFIRDVGFPIFVAVYLLVQMTSIAPQVQAMARSMDQIAQTQVRLLTILEKGR
jgi:hypothetical protein